MAAERSITVWISVKFRDADGNQPRLDEVGVAVRTGDNLVRLVHATVEKLKDILPPNNDRFVVSKSVAAPLNKFVRILARELVEEKCEENGLYRVELLRPGDSDQPFYTLPLRHSDNTSRPQRRRPTNHAQSDESEAAKKASHHGLLQ